MGKVEKNLAWKTMHVKMHAQSMHFWQFKIQPDKCSVLHISNYAC